MYRSRREVSTIVPSLFHPILIVKTILPALQAHSTYEFHVSASAWSKRARSNPGCIPGWWTDLHLDHPFSLKTCLARGGMLCIWVIMATCFHPRRCQEGNHDLSSCKGGYIPIFLPFVVVLMVVFGLKTD